MAKKKSLSGYRIKKATGYILYIDILGYKEAVLLDDGESIEKLKELLVKMQPLYFAHHALFEGFNQDKLYVNYFSDNILIFYPSSEPDINVFAGMCYLANIVQASGICRGFLTRGSLSYGSIEYNHTIVFGKAVIDSYEYEKNNLWPSVCLSPELKDFVETNEIKMEDKTLSPFGYFHETDHYAKKVCLAGIEKALRRLNHQKVVSESILSKYEWLIGEYNRYFNLKIKKKLVRLPSAIYKIEDDNNVGLWD